MEKRPTRKAAWEFGRDILEGVGIDLDEVRITDVEIGVEGITVSGLVTTIHGAIMADTKEGEPLRWFHTFEYDPEGEDV